MHISTQAFHNGETIPKKYTCDGENINPPLSIEGVPVSAKKLALIVDDPDAPAGTWIHWTLWNIDPATKEIGEGTLPPGAVEGKTSFGTVGYGGPCPHKGTHRYFFKLYALDTPLNLSTTSEVFNIEEAMRGHILADARYIGIYSRE